MLIDRIRSKVIGLLNTDILGNFRNEDFNSFLHHAIQDRYEDLFRDLSHFENMENAGRVRQFIQSQADKTRTKMLHYYATNALADTSDSIKGKPADTNYIDDVVDDTLGYSYEQCDNMREFNILKTAATSQYPVFVDNGTSIQIAPDNAGDMTAQYLRVPNIPKWTYNTATELFNPSAGDFVDADVHPSEEVEIVRRVLMSFGVNLKEQEITAFSLNKEQVEFNQENSL